MNKCELAIQQMALHPVQTSCQVLKALLTNQPKSTVTFVGIPEINLTPHHHKPVWTDNFANGTTFFQTGHNVLKAPLTNQPEAVVPSAEVIHNSAIILALLSAPRAEG